MWQPLLIFAGCIPGLILIAAIYVERLRQKRQRERSPLSEKLLRPAGYSLLLKIEALNDSFMTWFIGIFLFSMGAIGIFSFVPTDAFGRFICFVVSGIGAAICAIAAWRKLNQIRNCRRGLLGEQAVAEQLQTLFASGYRVFHDIPGSGEWNIDHVVVGLTGVFAIETKYRTKKPGKNGAKDHEAIFDGNRIEFASGDYDAKAVEQASTNARWLEKELSKATGERVIVRPIVALPGWFVTLKTNSDVKVLSGKQVAGFIARESKQLSESSIQRISLRR